MLIRSTALAFFAFSLVSGAQAQEFSGRCTDYRTDKTSCTATGWCRWAQPTKQVVLADGTTAVRAGYCAFKRDHKAKWAAQQQQ